MMKAMRLALLQTQKKTKCLAEKILLCICVDLKCKSPISKTIHYTLQSKPVVFLRYFT